MKAEYQNALLEQPDISGNHEFKRAVLLIIYYLNYVNKLFPELKNPLPNPDKDIRNTFYFKCAISALRDKRFKFKDDELVLWVKSQLQVLRACENDVLVSPRCLFGEKAWIRWKIWSDSLKQKREMLNQKIISVEETKITANELINCHKKCLERGGIEFGINKNLLKVWLKFKIIIPAYLLVLPKININFEELGIDISNERKKLNQDEVIKFFDYLKRI